MSAAVIGFIGFTIITIIFTPLSFIVALFALPIDRFQKQVAKRRKWFRETLNQLTRKAPKIENRQQKV